MLLRRRSFFTSPQIRRKEVVSRRRSRRHASAFDENASPKESSSIKKVVVLGGGFGGLYCALKLDSLFATNTRGDDSVEKKKPTMIVTLIDTNEKFLFKPLMYELLNSDMEETDVAPLYEELLENTTVRFLQKEAMRVEPEKVLKTKSGSKVSGTGGEVIVRDVETKEEERVKYDYLVVSLGAKVDFESEKNFVKGAREFAMPFNGLDDVKRMREKIERLKEDGAERGERTVAVVGAGYAGVELALCLARWFEREDGLKDVKIKLVAKDGKVLSSATVGGKNAARKALEKASNVEIVDGVVGAIERSSSESSKVNISLTKGDSSLQTIENVDMCCWTVGLSAKLPTSENDWPFEQDPRTGKIVTDSTLKVAGYDRVFALGDNSIQREYEKKDAANREEEKPATAQVAFQAADYCAWNVWSAINKKSLLPFRYQHLGDMMTLGDKEAAVQFPVGEETTLDGSAAFALRRLAYLYRMPTNGQRLKIGRKWLSAISSNPSAFVGEVIEGLNSYTSSR
ncbi:unnamed protein product [Bathycoccus prasinos]|mmetsp:Transcript_4176/g.14584  ORF Transcript_4176/g.14584 Transcript_4176/m.14584 type:complete len:514 (+) Transcript_4176:110-1651(+)